MYYIFNSQGQYLAGSDAEPNLDDLATRGEQAVVSDKNFANPILIDGVIVEQLPSIDEQRQQIRNAINALRDKKINGGVYVPEIDKWIDTDATAERNILSVKASFDLLGDMEIAWTCADNSILMINKDKLMQIWQALMQAKTGNHANALRHKAALEQTDNPLEYDFSDGWTECYHDYLAQQGADND